MNRAHVLAALRSACDKAGSQKSWAAQNGISLAHVNDVIHGRREPAKKVLDALGLERIVSYRRQNGKAVG